MSILYKIREQIKEQLQAWEIPSAGICIVKDGQVVMQEGLGFRDNTRQEADGRTLYQIASCTKAFTATAAAVLATEGKLDFDRPVIEYMPDFRLHDRYATEHLTVRDFLSHRSGLPRHEYAWYGTGFSREQLMRNLKDLPLNAPIRYRFQYSNFNYLIVGCLIEAVSGMKFEEFLSEKILKPLGMTHTRVYLADILKEPDRALAFDREKAYTMQGVRQIPYYESPAENMALQVGDPTAAAGCVVSCAEDMAKWLQLNLNRGRVGEVQLVREDLMDLLVTPHIHIGGGAEHQPQRSATSYALGWEIYEYRGHKMIEHGGNINGFSSSTAFVPQLNLGVFVSVNMNVSLLPIALVQRVIDQYLGTEDTDWFQRMYRANEKMYQSVKEYYASFGGEAVPDTRPSHALMEYAGDYELPGYRRFRILYQNGRLRADFNTFVVDLHHHHYDSFATEGEIGELPSGLILTFQNAPDGGVASLSVTLGGEAGLGPMVFVKSKEEIK